MQRQEYKNLNELLAAKLTRYDEHLERLKKENDMNYSDKINSQLVGEQAVKNQRFIVGSVSQNGDVSFAANPALHIDVFSARAECKRLALQNLGKTFIFVQLKGAERGVPQPTALSI